MKLLLFLLLMSGICNAQVRSSFERDGKIWVSYDNKNAQTQTFRPIEQIYQCRGSFMNIITDTIRIGNTYKIIMGTKWVTVNIPRGELKLFNEHIMFMLMAACFDDKFIYCQCTATFPIIKKNF